MDDNYKDLGLCICEVAVDDYRTALRMNEPFRIRKLEKFFRSEWFALLSQGVVDGQTVIMEVRSQWTKEKMLRRS